MNVMGWSSGWPVEESLTPRTWRWSAGWQGSGHPKVYIVTAAESEDEVLAVVAAALREHFG